jgi:methyl-accepting chemotaxis protein
MLFGTLQARRSASPPMKKNGFSHINRSLWLFALIVMLSTMGVYWLVFHEVVSILRTQPQLSEALSQTYPSNSTDSQSILKVRLIFILSAGLLAILLLSIIWVRMTAWQLKKPIHAIRHAVLRMAQGKLNETVSINSIDELGQIGGGINELAANLQELLLYIWKQSGQCMASLETMQNHLDRCDDPVLEAELRESLRHLTASVEDLRLMANAYVFYDVCLEGDRAQAINLINIKKPPASVPL